jgi:Domain of unknown function (DUF1918)
VIGGRRAGQPDRKLLSLIANCEVLEVHHPNGEPPYVVRWRDTGKEDLFVPGSDATIVKPRAPSKPNCR